MDIPTPEIYRCSRQTEKTVELLHDGLTLFFIAIECSEKKFGIKNNNE